MGLEPAPKKCFLTDFITTDRPINVNEINYSIDYFGKQIYFNFQMGHSNTDIINSNKHIFRGLIANNKLDLDLTYNNDNLTQIIESANYPRTPKEKIDNFIIYLSKLQSFDGSTISIQWRNAEIVDKLYMKNFHELEFYLDNLKKLDYIKNGGIAYEVSLTLNGLNYLIQLTEFGFNSKNCFIAMSFSDKMESTREIIKSACMETGYNAILVDELNIKCDITINDEIISQIKSCKFVIADFTEQKHGVYFEAGYAIGKGKEVIYVCSESDFKNTHFDTSHYSHIIYSDLIDLKRKLISKIRAWIE